MTHESRLFGTFTYTANELITFRDGLLGFEQYTKYVLKRTPDARPIDWLLSVEECGPELALLNPGILEPAYSVDTIPLSDDMLRVLDARSSQELRLYAVLTLPENIHHISMNLRTPVLLNPHTHLGLQYPVPGIAGKPIRRQIYRDLLRSRPEDKPSTVVTLRKVGETVEVGEEVTIQVAELADGGVRLAITAPKRVPIRRGTRPVTPMQENLRANEEMHWEQMKGLLRMYNVGTTPAASLAAHDRAKAVNEVAG